MIKCSLRLKRIRKSCIQLLRKVVFSLGCQLSHCQAGCIRDEYDWVGYILHSASAALWNWVQNRTAKLAGMDCTIGSAGGWFLLVHRRIRLNLTSTWSRSDGIPPRILGPYGWVFHPQTCLVRVPNLDGDKPTRSVYVVSRTEADRTING